MPYLTLFHQYAGINIISPLQIKNDSRSDWVGLGWCSGYHQAILAAAIVSANAFDHPIFNTLYLFAGIFLINANKYQELVVTLFGVTFIIIALMDVGQGEEKDLRMQNAAPGVLAGIILNPVPAQTVFILIAALTITTAATCVAHGTTWAVAVVVSGSIAFVAFGGVIVSSTILDRSSRRQMTVNKKITPLDNSFPLTTIPTTNEQLLSEETNFFRNRFINNENSSTNHSTNTIIPATNHEFV